MRNTRGSEPFDARRRWEIASAICLLYAVASVAASAQTFTTLYNFCSLSSCTDGAAPQAGLVQATNGELYGTTSAGGSAGFGTVFSMTPGGALTTLHSFCLQSSCADGSFPVGGLVQTTDGDFYGTTDSGGVYGSDTGGYGTIFDLTPSGTFTTVQSFDGTDGQNPLALLVQSGNGTLYGTAGGGAYAHGEVFKLTSGGTLSALVSLCERYPCPRGAYPYAGLLMAADGSLYGTTLQGGVGTCNEDPPDGCGVVFKTTVEGKATVLYSFCILTDCLDGQNPLGALVQGSDGNLYGTTQNGGANCVGDYGCGTVFKMTTGGVLTTLYSFCSQSGCADGANPYAGLIQGSDGNLYGTTGYGGASGQGTIFKITPAGELTTLYSFCAQNGCTDGANPTAPLVEDTNGELYGTAFEGGTAGFGVVFRISAGLGEFVEPEPSSGEIGSTVEILGTAIGGATSVTFNGAPASFTVSSSSLITTTVPAGATTGRIEVTTPHGTIRSNVRFRVLQ